VEIIVYFVNENIFDYFDFNFHILVTDIKFKDLFLRNKCSVLPLTDW
jgi:hypothetical protein